MKKSTITLDKVATKSILEFDMDIVKGNLYNAVFSTQRNEKFKPTMGIKRIYFTGATLCMDTNNSDVLTLNHDKESIGFFSGGIRRLLPIDCMRLLETLMNMYDISHTQKWVIKREKS